MSQVRTLLFTSNDPTSKIPNIQFHLTWNPFKRQEILELFLKLGMNLNDEFWTEYIPQVASEKPLCLCLPTLTHPKSRGEVTLNSKDPLTYPRTEFNYLTIQEDVEALAYALNLLRKI